MTNDGPPGSGRREVPLSALEHYEYCSRQAALIHVDGIWSDSADTVRGDLSHTAVDLPGVRQRRGVDIVRSLPVWSDQYGLRGICDVVEFEAGTAVPVEFKVGRYHPGGPAEVQLGGQALCLIEAGFEVPVGYVYSVSERRRNPVPITAELLNRVISATTAVRDLLTTVVLPESRNDVRCRNCSLREDCLPELTRRRQRATPDLFTPKPLGRWRD